MLDSFSYMEDYLPLREINWDAENLGVLLYEGYMGVERSHGAILKYFIHRVNKKSEVPSSVLAYVSKTLLLGIEERISSAEILRGKGNKSKKKVTLPADMFSVIPALKGRKGDLKSFYEKLSDYPVLVGYTSPDNIEKMHGKERERRRRLLAVKKLLDDIVEIHIRLYNSEPITFEGSHYISDQHEKLQQIYKNANKLW
jgi:hypothetical protein